jgi:hypothetical protein
VTGGTEAAWGDRGLGGRWRRPAGQRIGPAEGEHLGQQPDGGRVGNGQLTPLRLEFGQSTRNLNIPHQPAGGGPRGLVGRRLAAGLAVRFNR